jgi:glyoxylase-like metal-dependent hydrolase (beta-lactamase superfamily II)
LETIMMFHQNHVSSGILALDRRKFLALAGTLAAAGLLPSAALALAGPYAFKQGAYDVTVVSDGTLMLNIAAVFPGSPADEVKKLLGPAVKGEEAEVDINILLLKSGSDTILIDTGAGGNMAPTAGKMLESLKTAGTDPSAITKVIYTHAHPDHLWGSVGKDGALTFPNASFHMADVEHNFWSAPDLASKMPKAMEGMVMGIQSQLTALKDKLSFFKPGAEVAPGIAALDTAGHTPGHVSFEMAGGDGLILTGDAVTAALVFFAHPDWKFGFDADQDMAIASRKKLLDMAASGKKKMLGYHWPYPGLAMAEAKDGAFVYVPAS